MKRTLATLCAGVVLSAVPALAQIETRKIEELQNQQALRQGRAFAVGVGARLPVAIVGLIRVAVPAHTDLVAMAVTELVRGEGDEWKPDPAALTQAVQTARSLMTQP